MSYLPYEPQQQSLLPQARRGARGLPPAQVAGWTSQWLDQERAGISPVQHARSAPGASRVEARVHGAEPAAHGSAEREL